MYRDKVRTAFATIPARVASPVYADHATNYSPLVKDLEWNA